MVVLSKSILCEDDGRISLFPIPLQNTLIWQLYKKHESTDWNAGEIDFTVDKQSLGKLNSSELLLLKRVVTFFAKGDDLINLNIEQNIERLVKMREAKILYDYKKRIENVHIEVYSKFIENYMPSVKEQKEIFNDVKNNISVSQKFKWIEDYINNLSSSSTTKSKKEYPELTYYIFLDYITEGLFFSGSFCIIFWFKSRNLLHALSKANDLIRRDETIHVEIGALLYNKYIPKDERLDEVDAHNIIKMAVDTEIKFMANAMPKGAQLAGMNINLMSNYIKFMADFLLTTVGYNKIYNVKNPFPFMEQQGLQGKKNFFEESATEYKNITATLKDEDKDNGFGFKRRKKNP